MSHQLVTHEVRGILVDLARFCRESDEGVRQSLQALAAEEWPLLFQLASTHRVLGNLSRIVADMPAAPPLSRSFARRQLIMIKRQAATRRFESSSAITALNSAGVTAVPLKGYVLGQQCYPEFYLRETGDLDLLVHIEDLDPTHKVLTDIGFTQSQIDPATAEISDLSAARLQGYEQELQHLGEFTKVSANGSVLTIDVHFRLSTVFDHLAPQTAVFLHNLVDSPDAVHRQFRPELFVAHLGYHAWWDTQSLTNVRSGLDLRLFQYTDILLAFTTWNLSCDDVLRWSDEAGIRKTSNWALWITSELFGPLPGSDALDVDAAVEFDQIFTDRWLQRSTAGVLGKWDDPAPSRIFDLGRGDTASAMIAGWLDAHTKKGDVLSWTSREATDQ